MSLSEAPEQEAPAYACILLAAGASVRMGQPKQLMLLQGEPLLHRTIRLLSAQDLAPIIVVLGAYASAIAPVVQPLAVPIIINTHWQSGMGRSIAVGLAAALERWPQLSGVIIAVADQPFLSATIITQLIHLYEQSQAEVVASRYSEEAWGTPALFSSKIFDALARLEGSEGGRKLILKFVAHPPLINFPLGSLDLDTPEDWEKGSSLL